jgi:hypothetical protein
MRDLAFTFSISPSSSLTWSKSRHSRSSFSSSAPGPPFAAPGPPSAAPGPPFAAPEPPFDAPGPLFAAPGPPSAAPGPPFAAHVILCCKANSTAATNSCCGDRPNMAAVWPSAVVTVTTMYLFTPLNDEMKWEREL